MMMLLELQLRSMLVGIAMNTGMICVTYIAALFSSDQISGRCCGVFATRSKLISYTNCFAIGVFFGTLFLGHFPMVSFMVDVALKHHRVTMSFPLAETLILSGFFCAFAVDQFFADRRRAGHDILAIVSDLGDRNLTPLPSYKRVDGDVTDVEDNFCFQDISERSYPKEPVAITFGPSRVYSLLEGLTLGLQENKVVLMMILFGVYLHEFLRLMTVGLRIGGSGLPTGRGLAVGMLIVSVIPSGQVRRDFNTYTGDGKVRHSCESMSPTHTGVGRL